MDDFTDRPLERAQTDDAPPTSRSRMPLVLIAVVGLALGAAAAWWWTREDAPPAAVADAPAPPAEAPPAVAESPRELPPVDQMDTFLRALLGTLSAHPDLARWLATDNLVRQMAHGIDLVSRGDTPARDFPVFRPRGEFEVRRAGSRLTIDPASYRRYDSLAALVDSLDPNAVAEAYRTIQPRLDEAYRALGRAEGGVDDAVRIGLQLLIDTPMPTEPVEVVFGEGANYVYADERFERLRPVQKQLLRMGPENAQRVQARLRDIQTALGR